VRNGARAGAGWSVVTDMSPNILVDLNHVDPLPLRAFTLWLATVVARSGCESVNEAII
jgi:hypothetical protein